MGIVSTKAIVLSSIKYGDSNLIVKCFTKAQGIKNYIVYGILKSKKPILKPAYFQPLTQIRLTENKSYRNNLQTIKEVSVVNVYKTIYRDVTKQTIVLFLSEVLSKVIREEEENNSLYNYLENSLIWLDSNDYVANFHLLFLLNLSRYLGIYPNISGSQRKGFDMLEGTFTDQINEKEVISAVEIITLKKIFVKGFDQVQKIDLCKAERQKILQTIIRYFELHLEGFKPPKSLSVLEMVFS